jgi:hypothetical protein
MKAITRLITIALVLLLVACSKTGQTSKNNNITIHGSGNIISEEIDMTDFNRLDAGLHFNLTICQGKESKITVTSDDNFIDFIQIDQKGSALTFRLKPDYAYNFDNVTLQVEVSMPDLAGLSLSESSYALLKEAQSTENFDAKLSGSSILEGDLQAVAASFDLSGSTYVNLVGSVEHMQIDSCGNSVADLQRFTAENAKLEVSCNSKTSVTVNGVLDIDASQYSQVFYYGEPETLKNAYFENAFIGQK